MLHEIRQNVLEGRYLPIIHIEAHGNDDKSGLCLASNETITWREMKLPLSEINIATRFNLMLCISSCYGGQAIRRLNNGLVGDDAEFYFTTAEQFYELIWINYLQKQCTNENLNKRANYIVRELRKKKSARVPSRNEIKRNIIHQHPVHFEKSKINFFMLDLFDENKDRFTVDFETALHKSKEAHCLHRIADKSSRPGKHTFC